MKIQNVKKGEYITLKEIAEPKESQVYIRGDYIREIKKYELISFNDINKFRYIKKNTEVFTDFTF